MLMSSQDHSQDDGLSSLMASLPIVPDYESMFSKKGKRIKELELRKSFVDAPHMMIMNQGQPSSDPLPFASATFTLRSGETVTVGEEMAPTIGLYSLMAGIPGFDQWLLDYQKKTHSPPQMTIEDHPSPFKLIFTAGSFAGLRTCVEILMDEDDTILSEDIIYASMLQMVTNHGAFVEMVTCDIQGMLPDSLDATMTNWHQNHQGRPKPRLLYAIPYGNNPKGNSWSDDRIAQIYLMCRKHNLLVLDDGAYHFLRWGKKCRSLQSVDVDGRVLRLDTFSKILGAGHRVGWLTGPKAIVEKVHMDTSASYMHPSTLSQAFILGTLKTWGYERFLKEMDLIAEFYRKKSQCLVEAANRHLKGLVEFDPPSGGMFLWMEIVGVSDSTPVVTELQGRNVIVVAGEFFKADRRHSNGIRLSFSLIAEEKMDKAMQVIAEVIREHNSEINRIAP